MIRSPRLRIEACRELLRRSGAPNPSQAITFELPAVWLVMQKLLLASILVARGGAHLQTISVRWNIKLHRLPPPGSRPGSTICMLKSSAIHTSSQLLAGQGPIE